MVVTLLVWVCLLLVVDMEDLTKETLLMEDQAVAVENLVVLVDQETNAKHKMQEM